MNTLAKHLVRAMVWATALSLPLQSLSANCCACRPSQHESDAFSPENPTDGRECHCCSRTYDNRSCLSIAQASEPPQDAPAQWPWHPCDCPSSCPCHLRHAIDPATPTSAAGQEKTSSEASNDLCPPSRHRYLRSSTRDVRPVPSLAPSALQRCATLCRFSI